MCSNKECKEDERYHCAECKTQSHDAWFDHDADGLYLDQVEDVALLERTDKTPGSRPKKYRYVVTHEVSFENVASERSERSEFVVRRVFENVGV